MRDFPKVPLILSPTPLHRLNGVSVDLGIDLWIKRDDLTGFALGGNKGRKLEYFIADALARGADVVVTCGSAQSNFIRQLGAACAMVGLKCAAAVMGLPYEDSPPTGTSLRPDGGNVKLAQILGTDLRLNPNGTWDELYAYADQLEAELTSAGKRVYRIPIGGSSPLGAYGFVRAAKEIREQSEPFDRIVFASSSGSTQVGLQYGFYGSSTQVLGIACDPEPEIMEDFASLGNELSEMLGGSLGFRASDFNMNFDFVGPGYGVPSEAGNSAIAYLARREGVFLDPIYSGKAFSAVIALARAGELPGRTLFWHTGGTPALFAME